MPKKSWLYVVAALVIIAAVVVAVFPCKDGPCKPEGRPMTALTPEMSKAFGAMTKVPGDASFYGSSMHILGRWQAVLQSNAVQSLFKLPIVQQLSRHPALRGIQMQAAENPLFVQGLPVLKDAISSEVFVCGGPELAGFIEAVSQISNNARLASMKVLFAEDMDRYEDEEQSTKVFTAIIDSVLERKDGLRVPSVLVGFKLTKPDAAKKFLDAWISKIGRLPVSKIKKKQIAGAEFYTLKLSGTDIPKDGYEEMREGLADAEIPKDKADKFEAWIKRQKLTIALGVKDGYLMLSIASDSGMLDTWGQGPSLAESRAVEPARKHFKPGLIDVSYVSSALINVAGWTADDLRKASRAVLDAIPDKKSTVELKKRLRTDLPRLVEDVVTNLPQTGGTVSFSFKNEGVESYSFTETPRTLLDCSKPLTILSHRGKGAMFYSAGRAASSPGTYEAGIKWLKLVFGYVEDFAIPTLKPKEQREFKKAMKIARPFLTSVDKTTSAHLVPSIDGVQSIMTLDGHGMVTRSPAGGKLPKPLYVPRLNVVVELNDPEEFKLAMSEYVGAVKALLASVKKEYPKADLDELELPPHKESEVAGGTLYFYQLPFDLGADVFPCALMKDRLLVLSSSSRCAKQIVEPSPMPQCSVTHPDGAAGAVTAFNGPECWKLLGRTADFVLTMVGDNARRERDQQMAMMVRMHLTALWRSLGAIRSYRSTVTHEDGYLINHSWLRVEDISP